MPTDRHLSEDEAVVVNLAEEDSYGFVEIAGTIGDVARAQAAVRRLLSDGLVVVEQRERWDTGPVLVLPSEDASKAIDVPDNWEPRDDPSLPWHQVALPAHD